MVVVNKIAASDVQMGGQVQKMYLGDALVWLIGSDVDFGDWDLVAEVKWAKYDGTPNIIMPKLDDHVFFETMFIPDDSSNLTGILKLRRWDNPNGGSYSYTLSYRQIYGYLATINFLYVNWLKIYASFLVYEDNEYPVTSITFQPEAYINQYCTDMYAMLRNLTHLDYIDLRGFDTSNVSQFEGCLPEVEEIDIRGWSTRSGSLKIPFNTKYLWISKEFFDYGYDFDDEIQYIHDILTNILFTGTDVQKTQQCCEQFIQAMLGCRKRVRIVVGSILLLPTENQYVFEYIKSMSNGRLEAYGWEFDYDEPPINQYSITLKKRTTGL